MKLQHIAAATLALAALVAMSIPVEAKRARSNIDYAKLRSDIADLKRQVAALRKPKIEAPGAMMLAAIAAFPPEGLGQVAIPPVGNVPPPVDRETPKPTLTGYRDNIFRVGPRADLRYAPAELRAFINKVQAACGPVTVISGYRPGSRVAGSGRVSLHASGRAVDYQIGNPACALKLAQSIKRGCIGHSNDYTKVSPPHFHASCAYGSGEFGRIFSHYGGKTYAQKYGAKRYAKRWKARSKYARRHYRRADLRSGHELSAAARPIEQHGIASHYGTPQRVACGGQLDPQALTAAHRTLPCGTRVTVTNLRNGRTVVVVVRDRGPFIPGRIIDVTPAAARKLGFSGLARVSVKRRV